MTTEKMHKGLCTREGKVEGRDGPVSIRFDPNTGLVTVDTTTITLTGFNELAHTILYTIAETTYGRERLPVAIQDLLDCCHRLFDRNVRMQHQWFARYPDDRNVS